MLQNYHTEFLTGTIYNWNHLLKKDRYKEIMIESFNWLVKEKRCTTNAFVIMPNHFHLIWKISDVYERKNVQGAFFSFTAHQFKKALKSEDCISLDNHYVNKIDRTYPFWEREPFYLECWTEKFFMQKLDYIHYNPCQPHWMLVEEPQFYKWSSAKFYETGINDFEFLTHYDE